jgi:predicted nucleotidyltransferase
MNWVKFIGRKKLDTNFQSNDLFKICKIVEPFLEKLVLVGGWAVRVNTNNPQNNEYGGMRITNDVDFAVQLVIGGEFRQIAEHIEKQQFLRAEKPPIRFKRDNTIIDILPFGEGQSEIISNLEIKEYELAFLDNRKINIVNTENQKMTLQVIGVGSSIVHKIFSYTDNTERRKDLEDIYYLLENYGNDEEKLGLSVKRKTSIEDETVPYEFASAHILGRIVQVRANNPLFFEAKEKLKEIINKREVAELEGEVDKIKRLKILLEYFEDKYESFT